MQRRVVLPFSAIVGLDKLRLAIIINAINPKIGGLLIRGPKGSGKTTVVRALADILPKITAVKDCPFQCDPHDPSNMCSRDSERYLKGEKLPSEEKDMRVVDLPLGATEDRVVGSLDVQKVIKLGVQALEPGILAEANQNILYVDEVNLLPDHIADDLLDAAATGWNVVEREGISVSHPSRFVFVGTMNPEEGELRPQLLDRFPLSVGVERITAPSERMEVVKRNVEFERNPEQFYKEHKTAQEQLRSKIIHGRETLSKVELPETLLEVICKACADLKVDGMRPDIVISKAASTLAAFEDRTTVTLDDVLIAAELALSHRTREGGFLEAATPEEIRQGFLSKTKEAQPSQGTKSGPKSEKGQEPQVAKSGIWPRKLWKPKDKASEEKKNRYVAKRFRKGIYSLDEIARGHPSVGNKEDLDLPNEARALQSSSHASAKEAGISEGTPLLHRITASALSPLSLVFKTPKPHAGTGVGVSVGKRADTVTSLNRGRASGWRFPHGRPRDIHLPATIRAAALGQRLRNSGSNVALQILPQDVREKSRIYKAPMTIILVIDVSKSMMYCIDQVRQAVLKLHGDAYRHRDRIGIVALKGTSAVVAQHPITNLRVVANKLLKLHVSGQTPLAAGMLKASEVLKEAKRRDRSTIPVMIILTDGEANIPLKRSLQTGEVRTLDLLDAAFFKYEAVAIDDVSAVAESIKKEGIYTVVVNTNPVATAWESSGFVVTQMIANVTNGKHHEVGRMSDKGELTNRIFEAINQDERVIGQSASSKRDPLRY